MSTTVSSKKDTPAMSLKSHVMPYFVFLLGTSFYVYEFVLQVSPDVMTNQLMKAYGVQASGLGIISAAFYYAYTPMQFPAGMLYDRFGPRLLLTVAIAICASGALFFSTTDSVWMAAFGRFCIGFGAAFSFLGGLLLVAHWFSPKYFALMAGLVQLMSSLGAFIGEGPIATWVHHFGWRRTIFDIAIVGFCLSALVFLALRDKPGHRFTQILPRQKDKETAKKPLWPQLVNVCRKSQTWWIAFYAFLSWAPIVVFAALWGVPFLVEKYDISTTVAAYGITAVWVGIALGSPLIGVLSDKNLHRVVFLAFTGFLGFIVSMLVIYANLPWVVTIFLLFFFGLAAAGQALSFALVKDSTPLAFVGTAMGINNMAVVAGGLIFQPLAGWLLTLNWDNTMVHGVAHYSLHDYRLALLICPASYLLAGIVAVFKLKETYCKGHC